MNRTLMMLIALMFGATAITATAANTDESLPGLAAQPASYFYTGKPYDTDLGAYVFTFRNYDPELNRWTTPDPSGFPDGANGNTYAPSPTFQLDPSGLFRMYTIEPISGVQWTPTMSGYQLTFDAYRVMTNDGTTWVNLYEYVSGWPTPLPADWSYNCAGYVFIGIGSYWINPLPEFNTPDMEAILEAEGYRKIDGSDYTGAKIALWGNEHIAWVTPTSESPVGEVTGKIGSTVGLTTSTPEEQWTGTPSYWE